MGFLLLYRYLCLLIECFPSLKSLSVSLTKLRRSSQATWTTALAASSTSLSWFAFHWIAFFIVWGLPLRSKSLRFGTQNAKLPSHRLACHPHECVLHFCWLHCKYLLFSCSCVLLSLPFLCSKPIHRSQSMIIVLLTSKPWHQALPERFHSLSHLASTWAFPESLTQIQTCFKRLLFSMHLDPATLTTIAKKLLLLTYGWTTNFLLRISNESHWTCLRELRLLLSGPICILRCIDGASK